MAKRCGKCKQEKKESEFYTDKRTPTGLACYCKSCSILSSLKYIAGHVNKVQEARKTHYRKFKQKCNVQSKRWYYEHREVAIKRATLWNEGHPDKVRENWKKQGAKKLNTAKGRLSHNISTGINNSIKRGTKDNKHWEDLVDFTLDQLKKHIEKKFKQGWTWDNYGTVWHIDHKTPVSVFNFERPDDIDFRLCWSLKNLQPLGAKENIIKGNKINKPFQPSLAM